MSDFPQPTYPKIGHPLWTFPQLKMHLYQAIRQVLQKFYHCLYIVATEVSWQGESPPFLLLSHWPKFDYIVQELSGAFT